MATGSMTSIEEVARDVGGRLWMQLYVWPDRELSYNIVRRAAAAGFEALLVTVDTPVPPNREYNARNGFGIPFRPTVANMIDMTLHPRWFFQTMLKYIRTTGMPHLANHPADFNDPRIRPSYLKRVRLDDTVDHEEIRRLRDMWPGKLIVKGIVHPDDAREMVGHRGGRRGRLQSRRPQFRQRHRHIRRTPRRRRGHRRPRHRAGGQRHPGAAATSSRPSPWAPTRC